MVLRMLYVLPMLLGRTFDVNKNQIGIDIFSDDYTTKPRVTADSWFTSSYSTVESASDVRNVLGVSGDLSLKIKSNLIAVKGGGSYFTDTLKSENSVDVLIRVSFRTFSESLPPEARPVATWLQMKPELLGTHCVKSIMYGGDLVASVRFKAVKDENFEEIKGFVKASLEKGSAFQLVADGTLEKLERDLKGEASVEVSYYATVPLDRVPQNLEGLKELVANFKEQVQRVNNGWGVPMEVELQELSVFESRMEFLKNAYLESELEMFEESFDDLIATKSRMKTWLSSIPNYLSSEDEKKVDNLISRISSTIRVFFDVIANLDLTQGPSQLEPAKEAYKNSGKSRLVGKFRRELDKLIKTTVAELEEPPKKGSAVYIRYGKSHCDDKKTSTVFSGYMGSSPIEDTGNGRNYLCLPKNPVWYGEEPVSGNNSLIAGIKFGVLTGTPYAEHTEKVFQGIVCSVCLATERPYLMTFYDTKDCPKDNGWTEEYAGYMMTSTNVNKGQFVCIDESPESHTDSYMEETDQSLAMVKLKTEDMEKPDFVRCVVCTK